MDYTTDCTPELEGDNGLLKGSVMQQPNINTPEAALQIPRLH